jgi:hypothetical protein
MREGRPSHEAIMWDTSEEGAPRYQFGRLQHAASKCKTPMLARIGSLVVGIVYTKPPTGDPSSLLMLRTSPRW